MDVVYAVDTAPVELAPGVGGMVQKGSHWPSDDPVVRAHPGLFSTDPRYGMSYSVEPEGWDAPVDSPVESATAAPGEKRQTRRGGADRG